MDEISLHNKLTLFAFFALLVNCFNVITREAEEVRDKEKTKKRAKAVEGKNVRKKEKSEIALTIKTYVIV
jgi:hypothetical protein